MAELRILSWNIAHGRGLARRVSTVGRVGIERNLAAIAEVVREVRPDVVALQEVDAPSSWSGDFDHLERLSAWTGLPHRLHRTSFELTMGRTRIACGTALLSAHPWVRARSASFGSTWRCVKGWVAGTIDADGVRVEVFSVHLDFLNPRVRRRQVAAFADELSRTSVVAGDLNCVSADRGALADLVRRAPIRLAGPSEPTFPATAPRWRLDRVLVTPAIDVRDVRVLDVRHADHRPVVADLTVRSPEA
ncbi:MAG: endonuclease/exonuclease/phosphatase family protein [Myxococcota bacterium]